MLVLSFKQVGNMISTFSTASQGSDRFKGITDQFKSMTLAQQKAVLASKALDTAQKEALASSAGLTIAKNGQVVATEAVAVAEGEAAVATGTLAAAETGATATTGGLSAALSGLWATLAPVLTAIVSNPLTWAIAIGAAAVALEDFYSSTNILPFQ